MRFLSLWAYAPLAAAQNSAPAEEWQNSLGLWLLSHLPQALRHMGPYGLSYWQWLALPLFALLFWVATGLLKNVSKKLLFKLFPPKPEGDNQALATKLANPIRLLWFSILMQLFVPALALPPQVGTQVKNVLAASLIAALFWSLLKLVDVAAGVVKKRLSSRGADSANTLILSTSRLVKGLLLVLGVLSLLHYFGYPVSSMLAGLGVGGIAVALASQKTIENLLGAFLIRLDQPFKLGDFVHIGEVKGYVEHIGFRSTRIRTLERTLVTLPNGALADQRIENHATKDRFRLSAVVGLVYETQASQMKAILAGIESMLKTHPKIWEPNTITVYFKEMAASSLEVEMVAYFLAASSKEFNAIRQEVLLKTMEIVESAGSAMAFPSSTIYLAKT
ncbi:MAG: mechanosensitive ion channel family protein [Cystobacterineae bacterium]|nr:mechanosensitive ion channel family protein [Cystobacterineae bacterium]